MEEWQFFYNWQRPHSGLGGQAPMDRCCDLFERTPLRQEVEEQYEPQRERFRERVFSFDARVAALKRSPDLHKLRRLRAATEALAETGSLL